MREVLFYNEKYKIICSAVRVSRTSWIATFDGQHFHHMSGNPCASACVWDLSTVSLHTECKEVF